MPSPALSPKLLTSSLSQIKIPADPQALLEPSGRKYENKEKANGVDLEYLSTSQPPFWNVLSAYSTSNRNPLAL